MRLILVIFLLSFIGLFSQDRSETIITFNPILENRPIILEEVLYYNSNKDSLLIESLRFYVSNIELLNEKETVLSLKDNYYLIDLEYPESLKIEIPTKSNISFNSIKFGIGIDSITNSKGVMGGDLDPTKGMYWTWQSGYINFKLEGVSDKCNTRKNRFQYHLGGYQEPLNLYQEISLKIPSESREIVIDVDISSLLDNLDLSTTNQIMSPSYEALEIANFLPKIFILNN